MSGPGARRPRKPRAGERDGAPGSPGAPLEDPLLVLQTSLPPGISPSQLQCPICRELLNDPRDLPCGHTGCFSCLGGTVAKSGQTQCRVCRAPHALGGLGAFGLPVSRIGQLVQQLRTDARFVRAIKSLPPPVPSPAPQMMAAPTAGVVHLPTMAAGTSIFDPPATPFVATVPPQASSGDKYADFRALMDAPDPTLVPAYAPPTATLAPSQPFAPPAGTTPNAFAFLTAMAATPAPAPAPAPVLAATPAIVPYAAPTMIASYTTAPVLTSTPMSAVPLAAPAPSLPTPIAPTITIPTQPRAAAAVAPTPAVPLKPAAIVHMTHPPPPVSPTAAPTAPPTKPSATTLPSPRSADAAPATPSAAAAAAGENSFFARAAALFGSLSVAEAPAPAPSAPPAARSDGKPIAAPPARSFPAELLASLGDAEKAKLGIASPPPSAPAAATAPAPASAVPVSAYSNDNLVLSAPPAAAALPGAEFTSLDGSDDMFAGLNSTAAAGSPLAQPAASKEPLTRAEYAKQKREALKKKKADEAEQNAVIRKREAELEAQQRWELQRAQESQQSSVMQSKLQELHEKTRRENAERDARLKRQKELREEHRKTLLASDPAASPGASTATVPDASGPLNYAEFHTKEDNLRNLFNAWARDLWFAPDDLLSKAIFGPMQAMYCPFYLFDAKTVSQYSGQMCKLVEQTGPGGERKMADAWIPVTGVYKGTYSNILVCAAVGEEARYLCALKNWDVNKVYYEADGGPSRQATSSNDTFASKFFKAVVDAIPKLRPVREQLMPAEAWQIVWHEYEEAFVRPVEERQCSAKILAEEKGKGVSAVKVTTTYDVTRKLVYFPVFMCSYVYDNKSYRFLVHGQNSSVEAERPYGLGMVSSTAKQGLDALVGMFKR